MRATILANTTFQTLIAITAKFDLETIQIDTVNAFVYCDLDKIVYIKLPLGFNKGKKDKILHLRKALYRLQQSPLLQQKNFISLLTKLGFKEVPQKPYIMLKDRIVVFFYVNNIIFCYRKTDKKKAQEAIKELSKEYQISTFSELKWFLEIYMLHDYS